MQKTYRYDFSGIKLFWINRFLRLYPAYWIILIFSLLSIVCLDAKTLNPSMYFPTGIKEWFSNISMLFFDIVPHRVKPRLVPASWALTNELVFYFLISLGISKTWKRTFFWLIFSFLYYVATYLVYDIATFRYSAIPASSLPFAIGAALFWFNEKRYYVKGNLFLIILLFTAFNLNAVYLANCGVKICSEISIYINLVLAALIVLLLFKLKTNTIIKKMDTYVGYFSYPIYLSHYLICAVYIYMFGHARGDYKLQRDSLFSYFLILFVFSFIIIYFVDVRIENFRKKKTITHSNN